jgi:uncharacterized protein
LLVPESERATLMAIRRGELALDEVVATIDAATADLRRLAEDGALPAGPDEDRVDAFLVSAYRRQWSADG